MDQLEPKVEQSNRRSRGGRLALAIGAIAVAYGVAAAIYSSQGEPVSSGEDHLTISESSDPTRDSDQQDPDDLPQCWELDSAQPRHRCTENGEVLRSKNSVAGSRDRSELPQLKNGQWPDDPRASADGGEPRPPAPDGAGKLRDDPPENDCEALHDYFNDAWDAGRITESEYDALLDELFETCYANLP